MGFGLIGRIHTRSFMEQPDVKIVGVAEAYQPRLEAAAGLVGGKIGQYRDFRRLLDDKAVDAVVVATPDHWHALMTMMACAAGKDVYVEKPLTLFVREGRWMVDVARRTRRVVQVGTQQRSGPHYQGARADPATDTWARSSRSRTTSSATSCPASALRPTAIRRRAGLGHVAGPGPARPVQSQPSRSTISAGSGTIPAAR